MPRTKPQPRPARQSEPLPAAANGPQGEVLTLAEAAAYLRLSEDAVQTAIREQGLPGREVNGEWRLLKTGIQDWLLKGPKAKSNKEAWRALVGMWKDDSTVDELRQEIARQRERLQAEPER